MLIVEGPDGAGKTTLIAELKRYLPWPVAPKVVDKDTQRMVNIEDWVVENLERGYQRTIFDRHRLLSEPIYGPVLRGDHAWEPMMDGRYEEWFSRLVNIRPVILYCLPPFEVVKANVENDPDNSVVAPVIAPLYSGYVTQSAMMLETRAPTVIYDYTSDSFDALLATLTRLALR